MADEIVFGKENCGLEKQAPFLCRLSEGEDNCLSSEIALSFLGEAGGISEAFGDNEKISELLSKASPLYPDHSKIYEITFDRYIMYQVRNESYSSWDNYEVRRGKYFIVFERSRLLDYLAAATDCRVLPDGSFYPDKWTHYGIYCQNHIIDVVSAFPPTIVKKELNE
ncbi:MAG: hypothetical protein NC203_08980 [Firmicutes bacterium]|nr:hypothetical protein [[Eubacterium] siraeum]MCM1488486.1 hypothetical protein [Bacillota bacterium]